MIRRRVPRFSIPAGISYWPPTVPDAAPGVMSSTAAVIVDCTNGWLLPAAAGADQSVWGMSVPHVSEIWIPAAAPEPPVTWNVLPDATAIGWPLKFPKNDRCPADPCKSSDTIPGEPTTPPIDTSDWVVSGTPTADPDELAVDAPSDVHPPLTAVVYPDVCVGISVPAAAAVDAVLLSRIRIAEVPTGVPIAVPGIPAAPVGVSPFSRIDTSAWSMAAIYCSRLLPSNNGTSESSNPG